MSIRMEMGGVKEEYVQRAIEWGAALVKGDHETANKIHRRLAKIISQLSKANTDRKLFLAGLLGHPEPSVRLVAAVDSLYLGLNLHESELALTNLIANPSIHVLSLMALASLDAWRKSAGKSPNRIG